MTVSRTDFYDPTVSSLRAPSSTTEAIDLSFSRVTDVEEKGLNFTKIIVDNFMKSRQPLPRVQETFISSNPTEAFPLSQSPFVYDFYKDLINCPSNDRVYFLLNFLKLHEDNSDETSIPVINRYKRIQLMYGVLQRDAFHDFKLLNQLKQDTNKHDQLKALFRNIIDDLKPLHLVTPFKSVDQNLCNELWTLIDKESGDKTDNARQIKIETIINQLKQNNSVEADRLEHLLKKLRKSRHRLIKNELISELKLIIQNKEPSFIPVTAAYDDESKSIQLDTAPLLDLFEPDSEPVGSIFYYAFKTTDEKCIEDFINNFRSKFNKSYTTYSKFEKIAKKFINRPFKTPYEHLTSESLEEKTLIVARMGKKMAEQIKKSERKKE